MVVSAIGVHESAFYTGVLARLEKDVEGLRGELTSSNLKEAINGMRQTLGFSLREAGRTNDLTRSRAFHALFDAISYTTAWRPEMLDPLLSACRRAFTEGVLTSKAVGELEAALGQAGFILSDPALPLQWVCIKDQPPVTPGWYVVKKRGVPSPCILKFRSREAPGSWHRVLEWLGPLPRLPKDDDA